MARTWHRWLPAGAVVALVAGTVTLTSQAGAVDLPDRSPAEVLAMLAEHDVEAFSGTFETSAELGLPLPADIDLGAAGPDLDDAELEMPSGPPHRSPDSDNTELLDALELLTGDHTGRVFVGGPAQARLQHIDGMDERNVVVNERDVWFYDSETNEATHLILPDPADLPEPPEHREHTGDLPAPEQLAAAVVEALEPSTELTVGQHEEVAGRDAYTLNLLPRAAETLVEQVSIAVDGETGFPLGVTVSARGQAEPALRAVYTDIDFSAPDAALFDFSPPAGASVEEEVLELPEKGVDGDRSLGTFGWGDRSGHHGVADLAPALPGLPEVLGEGWSTVVATTGVEVPDHPLLDQFTEPVEGGRMLSTALLSVLLTDDGRVLAGAVTPEHLLDLAGR